MARGVVKWMNTGRTNRRTNGRTEGGSCDSTFSHLHLCMYTPGLDLIMISETADPPVVKVR